MIWNKKADVIGDVWIGIILIFILIFNLTISFFIWVNFNEGIQALDESIASDEVKAEIDSWTNWFLFLDYTVPFIFLVLWAGAIMSSLLVRPEHPLFFLIALALLFIFTFFSFILVDLGEAIFDDPSLVAFSSQLSMSMFFANNLHFITFFVMLISAVFFYGRGGFGGSGSAGGGGGIQL